MHDRSSARLITKVALSAALSLLAGCSDDDGAPDQGVAVDQGVVSDLPSIQDQSVDPEDKGVTQQDQGGGQDHGQQHADGGSYPDTGVISNSGAICNTSTACPSSSEECLYFGSTNGMCLGECQDFWDPCPVKDPNTQFSACAVQSLDGTKWYCGWFCEWGGKTYKCPDDTSYTCVASSSGKGKFCHPK
jgi:hypothetical protein